MALSNYSSLSFLKQNIANKNVDDAYYSETSPNDTILIYLVFNQEAPLNVYKTIKYLIFSRKTFTFFSLHKFKLV